jgi:DNA (cytosine-5)-methyltransferase 1
LLPAHDLLVAGFPCQPFSIAGVSKKNSLGRDHGFKDRTQGTLFFDVCRIIDLKRPSAFLLENVKNLCSHDKGNTFRIIVETLTEMGYKLNYKIVDARHWVPQHRERIYIVGFDPKKVRNHENFQFPDFPRGTDPTLASILEAKVDSKYTLSDKLWNYLQAYAKKHREKGNGFGFGLFGPKDTARTLSARYYKDGSEILIHNGRKNPRRLTPRECARIMGFPEEFKMVVSDTQAYKQFGNSVCVPLVTAIAAEISKILVETQKRTLVTRKATVASPEIAV